MDTGFVFALIPIVGVAILAFFVIGFSNDAKQGGRGKGLLSAFTHSVSVTMLGILVGCIVILLNLGLKMTVLPDADYSYQERPMLYLADTDGGPKVNVSTCDETCTLTDADKRSVRDWLMQYEGFRGSNPANPQYRNELVTAISFLVVALPLFIIFFRQMQKEKGRGETIEGMRRFYFYGVAVVGLIMTVVGAGLLINAGLKGVVGTTTTAGALSRAVPAPIDENSVQSVVNCADVCGFTEEEVALAQAWLDESPLSFEPNTTQRDLAVSIPVFVVGLPLFLFHFLTIRRETHVATPPPATV